MANQATETLIGALVLAAAGGFLVYAATTADIGVSSGYPLTAEFRVAGGLSSGADVRLSGVKVGKITSVSLNPQNYFAVVGMSINDDYKIPEDSIAKVTSDGLLGGNHIAISPGGSDFMLEPGASFLHTQGSIDLFDLITTAIHGMSK